MNAPAYILTTTTKGQPYTQRVYQAQAQAYVCHLLQARDNLGFADAEEQALTILENLNDPLRITGTVDHVRPFEIRKVPDAVLEEESGIHAKQTEEGEAHFKEYEEKQKLAATTSPSKA